MTAMNTMSRATVLTLVWLIAGPGLPVGGVPEGAAQTVEPAPAEGRNLDRAIAAQRRLVDEQKGATDRASALNDLANLLELRGDVEGAFEQYFAAIAADGAWAPAHYNLALLAYTTGDGELASEHLETAVELDPGNAWAHYQLGRIADDAGNAEAAVEHYVQALSLDTRLAFTDVNPHFAVNRYATEVLLKADRSRVEAVPPRTYSEPGRISSLLLPRMEEAAVEAGGSVEAANAEETPEQDVERPRRASQSPDREDASADDVERVTGSPNSLATPADRDRTLDGPLGRETPLQALEARFDPVDAAPGTADPEREVAARGGAAERPRVFTRENLRTRTLGGGRMVVGSPVGGAPSQVNPAGGSRGGVQLGTPVGPGGRQSTPPAAGTFRGGGRFQPGARSSAQLETTIRRLPVPAP